MAAWGRHNGHRLRAQLKRFFFLAETDKALVAGIRLRGLEHANRSGLIPLQTGDQFT